MIAPELTTRFALVLAHSLWQGLALALLLWVFLVRRDSRNPGVRHAAAWAALLGVFVAASATWTVLGAAPERHQKSRVSAPVSMTVPSSARDASPAIVVSQESAAAQPSTQVTSVSPAQAIMLPSASRCNMPHFIVCAWLGGVFVMLMRLVSGLTQTRRLRLDSIPVRDDSLTAWTDDLRRALGIRRGCHLALSQGVSSPSVFGVLANIVLIPATLPTAIPPDHLRALIAHELAHVARHDYLLNIVQSVFEALLFFNPAVWWIGRQIRREREACCDQLAARVLSGEPGVYAEALASVMEWSRTESCRAHTLLPAAGDPRRPSWLRDRVMRVLLPGHRPALQLPWHSLLLTLAFSVLVVVLVTTGTCVAVAAAARALSPAERMQRIDKVQQAYGVRLAAPESITTITGTVRFEGLPAEEAAKLMPEVNTLLLVPGRGNTSVGAPDPDGRFFTPFNHYEWVSITAWHNDWAASTCGPFDPRTSLSLELLLTRGYDSAVRVLGEDDRPLSGARVGLYRHRVQQRKVTTDPSGLACIAHLTTEPVEVGVAAHGYEPLRLEGVRMPNLKTTGPLEIRLRATKPATGIVVDEATSKPVEGAELFPYSWNDQSDSGYHDCYCDTASSVTSTSRKGQFALDELDASRRYTFLVRKRPDQVGFLHDVRAGQTGVRVVLSKAIPVSGRIVGPIRKLDVIYDTTGKSTAAPCIWACYEMPGARRKMDWPRIRVPVDVETSTSARFRVDGLPAGRIRLVCGWDWDPSATEVESDLRRPMDNITLRIPEAASDLTTRDVVLRFVVPPGSPPPGGTIDVYRAELDKRCSRSVRYPLGQSEVHLVVPVDSQVWYRPTGTTGYGFEEETTTVPSGKEPFVIPIQCGPAGVIYGHVVSQEGKLPEWVSVKWASPSRPAAPSWPRYVQRDYRFNVRSDGSFMATPLPLGAKYFVTVEGGDNGWSTAVADETVELTESNPTARVDVAIRKGSTLRGIVVDPSGAPIRNTTVSLSRSFGCFGDGRMTVVDDQGSFAFDGVVTSPATALKLACDTSRSWVPTEFVLTSLEPQKVVLEPGKTVEGVLLDSETGKPLQGQTVTIGCVVSSIMRQYTCERPTDAQGRFRFSNLPASGRCAVYVGGTAALNAKGSTYVSDSSFVAFDIEKQHFPLQCFRRRTNDHK